VKETVVYMVTTLIRKFGMQLLAENFNVKGSLIMEGIQYVFVLGHSLVICWEKYHDPVLEKKKSTTCTHYTP